MTNFYDSSILETQTNGDVYLDLHCGFGQPSVTTIYLKKIDGTVGELGSFDNNIINEKIGSIESLKYGIIEIHTTINDIVENEEERQDISLKIKVNENESNYVGTGFTKDTTGKGSIFHSFYAVTII